MGCGIKPGSGVSGVKSSVLAGLLFGAGTRPFTSSFESGVELGLCTGGFSAESVGS